MAAPCTFSINPPNDRSLGNVEQQIRRKIEIESGVVAIITGGFHKEIEYVIRDGFST